MYTGKSFAFLCFFLVKIVRCKPHESAKKKNK